MGKIYLLVKKWRGRVSSYASYLLQSAGDRPAGYKRDVPLSQSGVADGCRLLVWTDCTVKCGVSRITASCKVSLERWRWAQQSGDEDGDAGGVSSYSLLQGHAKCMQPELKRADYWRKWKFKQKIENYWTEKLTSCPKSKGVLALGEEMRLSWLRNSGTSGDVHRGGIDYHNSAAAPSWNWILSKRCLCCIRQILGSLTNLAMNGRAMFSPTQKYTKLGQLYNIDYPDPTHPTWKVENKKGRECS